jgi:enterochelin esterase-like enzyme
MLVPTIWNIPLLSGVTLGVISGVAAALVIILVISERGNARSISRIAIGAGVGGLLLGIAAWLLGDVFHVFGDFSLSIPMIGWAIAGGAGVGSGIGTLTSKKKLRSCVAVLLILTSASAAGVGINQAVGYFVTPKQVIGMFSRPQYPQLPSFDLAKTVSLKVWNSTAHTVTDGRLYQVHIPGTVSGFETRPAIVYLPPAALGARPARLPLVVVFSGQPGWPSDVFDSGHLAEVADAYARIHNGVAPIIVAPDQLGSAGANPMCADSSLGRNATYLSHDVFSWIEGHLPVIHDADHTAIMGFSQGGTCTLQLGFSHPELAHTLVPISPELQPTIGSRTIAEAFGGNAAAYQANTPLYMLRIHGPYRGVAAAFYVGESDTKYRQWAATLSSAARHSGIEASLHLVPHAGHNWHTAAYALRTSFSFVVARLGLPQ